MHVRTLPELQFVNGNQISFNNVGHNRFNSHLSQLRDYSLFLINVTEYSVGKDSPKVYHTEMRYHAVIHHFDFCQLAKNQNV